MHVYVSLTIWYYHPSVKPGQIDDPEEEGTPLFMVNVIQPQFNLHSEEANVSRFGFVCLN